MWYHILSQNVRHDIISNIDHIMWWTSDSSNHEIGGLKSCVNHGDFIGLMSVRSFYWLKVLVEIPLFVSFHPISFYSILFILSIVLSLAHLLNSLTHSHSFTFRNSIWYNLIIHSFNSFDSGLNRVSIPRVWPDQLVSEPQAKRGDLPKLKGSRVRGDTVLPAQFTDIGNNPEGRMNTSNFPFAWPIPTVFHVFPLFFGQKNWKLVSPWQVLVMLPVVMRRSGATKARAPDVTMESSPWVFHLRGRPLVGWINNCNLHK